MVVENFSQIPGTETTLPRIISNERRRYSVARIALVEPEQAPTEVQEVYDQKVKGKPGNAQKALAHRPDMLRNFLGFYASVGRSLDRKLYELIYIRTSIINQCHYCLEHHLASSKRVGLTSGDWKALEGDDNSRFTSKEQAALAYAAKLTRHPHSVNDADFTVLKKHFSDAEIVDLHLVTGLANLTNRFTDPLGLDVEFPQEKIQEQTR
jgi:uncharacterized peroxidase-related enzyme